MQQAVCGVWGVASASSVEESHVTAGWHQQCCLLASSTTEHAMLGSCCVQIEFHQHQHWTSAAAVTTLPSPDCSPLLGCSLADRHPHTCVSLAGSLLADFVLLAACCCCSCNCCAPAVACCCRAGVADPGQSAAHVLVSIQKQCVTCHGPTAQLLVVQSKDSIHSMARAAS